VDVTQLVIIDFVLGYIIGNLIQMAFRFWALRRFAFPETDLDAAATVTTDLEPAPRELGHS